MVSHLLVALLRACVARLLFPFLPLVWGAVLAELEALLLLPQGREGGRVQIQLISKSCSGSWILESCSGFHHVLSIFPFFTTLAQFRVNETSSNLIKLGFLREFFQLISLQDLNGPNLTTYYVQMTHEALQSLLEL